MVRAYFSPKHFKILSSKNFHSIVKLLSDMEIKWVDSQKQFQTAKILEKIEKGKSQFKHTQKCLQLYKSWNGPVKSIDELREILKANCGKAEKIVRTELS